MNNLKIWWNNLTFSGRPSFIFAKKLQVLKFIIKSWQEDTFGDLQSQLDNLELTIDVLDNLEEIQVLSDDDVVAREQAKVKHISLSLTLARRLAKRAKERWMKDGETNSNYLHQLASFKYKHTTSIV